VTREHTEANNTISVIKNTLEGINSRTSEAEERISELEDKMVKRLPTMQETWVQSLDWEALLEKEMVTHSSTLAWKIPWMEEPGSLQSMGSQRVRHD